MLRKTSGVDRNVILQVPRSILVAGKKIRTHIAVIGIQGAVRVDDSTLLDRGDGKQVARMGSIGLSAERNISDHNDNLLKKKTCKNGYDKTNPFIYTSEKLFI